jgi:hypothetical protein
MKNPKFLHDYACCTFLGHENDHDLYFCEQGTIPTVIARYGSEGPEYQSGLRGAQNLLMAGHCNHALVRALLLAEAQGLYPQ